MRSQSDCRKPEGSGSRSLWRALATGVSIAALTGGPFAAQAAATISATPGAGVKLTPAQALYLKQHPVTQARAAKMKPGFLAKPPVVNGALRAMSRNMVVHAAGVGSTVPYWTTNITSPLDHNTYTVSMVGSSPYSLVPVNTSVTYVPVEVRIHIGGFVVDPTAVSKCDTQSPGQRFFNSPIFQPNSFTSNGVNVTASGGSQLISAFQRANFWNAVKGTNYGVTLVPSRPTPIVVDWTPPNATGMDSVGFANDNCGGLADVLVAFVEINEFDTELQAIAASYAKTNQVPVSLMADTAIFEYFGPGSTGCCILGYHNAISVPGGTQLYAVGAYYDTNHFFPASFADTTIWAHELGELVNDPFVQSIPSVQGGYNNDLTPSWGPSGQVFGCQNNLEVGDPLTPDQVGAYGNWPVTGVGGFVYHYQDLAFHDWFYRTKSSSTGGKNSFRGTLPSEPALCE